MLLTAPVDEADEVQVLDELLSVVPVAVLVTDRRGFVTRADGDGLRLAGFTPERLVGRNVLDDIPADCELGAAVRAALRGARGRGTHVLGPLVWEFATSPRRDRSGAITGCHVLSFNVTDRGARERAEQENDAKTRFLAAISHELRTPLNSILGFNQLLGSESFGELNDRQKRYVNNIERSGSQLLALLNELLDLSKVSSGAMDFDMRPTSARLVAAAVVDGAAPLAAEQGVELCLDADPGVIVEADERRLGQALLNLVANAVKFTPAGGRVMVKVETSDRGAAISVSDTGVGIAAEDQEAIFQEFRQVPSAAAAGGTGLGLPLARRLVENMGGRLDLASQLGAGSTFTIRLPHAG